MNNELPLYQCHKRVRAAKIVDYNREPEGQVVTLILEGGATRQLPAHHFVGMQPPIGGYYVEYADGYASYSPAKAFEEGYALVEGASS